MEDFEHHNREVEELVRVLPRDDFYSDMVECDDGQCRQCQACMQKKAIQAITHLIQQARVDAVNKCIEVVQDAGSDKYVYDCSYSDDCFHDGVARCASESLRGLRELQAQLQETK